MTLENEEAKNIKEQCKRDINEAMANDLYVSKVRAIDSRLEEYINDAAE